MPAIEVQAINTPATDLGSTSLTKIPLLPGAIEGVETNYYMQVSGARCSPTRDSGRSQNFLFTAGAGEIQAGGIIFAFSEIAAFFTGGQEPIVIQATSDLEYLEVMIDLQDQEVQQLQARIPFFVRYSECEAYAETIKSAKTVSRTIVPAKTIPGFCMGSVESSGPDEVAAH